MKTDVSRTSLGKLALAGFGGLLAGLILSLVLPLRYRAEVALTAVKTPDPCPFVGETGGATFAHLGTIRDLLTDSSFLQEVESTQLREDRKEPSTASFHIRHRTDSHHLHFEVEADTREEASKLVVQWAELGVRRYEEILRRHIQKLPEERRSCAEANMFQLHKPLPWKPWVIQARWRHQSAALGGFVFGIFGALAWSSWRRKEKDLSKDGKA